MYMIIVGIDFSLNGPAVAVFNTDMEFNFRNCNFYYLTDIKKYASPFYGNIHGESFQVYSEECERYDTNSDWVMRKIAGCERLALEGYAYNSTGRVFNIAEATGILKFKLYQSAIPVDIYEPSKVKKFYTGKGNADKVSMYNQFVKETGIPLHTVMTPNKVLGSPVTDIIDSYAICKMLHSQL